MDDPSTCAAPYAKHPQLGFTMNKRTVSTMKITRRVSIAATIIAGACLNGCAYQPVVPASTASIKPEATTAPDVVATVNGVAIARNNVNDALRATGQPDSPSLREKVVHGLIVRELIRQAAEAENLGETHEVRTAQQTARIDAENRLFVSRHANPGNVSDDTVRAAYAAMVASLGTVSYKPRVLVLPNDEAAQKVLAQLERGEPFDRIAAKSGIARDGALPPVSLHEPLTEGQTQGLPLDVAKALVKLQPGEYTHAAIPMGNARVLVKLDGTIPTKVPAYSEVSDSIRQSLQKRANEAAFVSLVNKLQKSAVITHR
jgi:hypothetical protein